MQSGGADGVWAWRPQRQEFKDVDDEYTEIIEDFGNQDQLSFYVDYLFRAGATVVPMRPVGHQLNDIVLDNCCSGVSELGQVTFVGSWNSSSGSPYFTLSDTIIIPKHGWKTGDAVVYNKGGSSNTAIGGLEDGETYYAIVMDNNRLRLAKSQYVKYVDLFFRTFAFHFLGICDRLPDQWP